MEKIRVIVPSVVHHGAQIVTGFLMLKEQGWDVEIIDQTRDRENPWCGFPVVLAEYRGQRLFYDLGDGYNIFDDIQTGLNQSDFYFKRSYSREKNLALYSREDADKMYPLGLNYHVTHKKNPVREPVWKSMLKPLMKKTPDTFFTAEVFEGKAKPPKDGTPKILFLTQLWEEEEGLPEEANEERRQINVMRIHIVRVLRERYGEAFFGGLRDTDLAREQASELIVPAEYTERRKYLKLVHDCDICVGTMGLFESIGWKTAEYVAAAKAIVNERLHYTVPGNFRGGVNYIPFETAQECLDAVDSLVRSPEALQRMKEANQNYYQNYLRPDMLVKRTLALVDEKLEERHVLAD